MLQLLTVQSICGLLCMQALQRCSSSLALPGRPDGIRPMRAVVHWLLRLLLRLLPCRARVPVCMHAPAIAQPCLLLFAVLLLRVHLHHVAPVLGLCKLVALVRIDRDAGQWLLLLKLSVVNCHDAPALVDKLLSFCALFCWQLLQPTCCLGATSAALCRGLLCVACNCCVERLACIRSSGVLNRSQTLRINSWLLCLCSLRGQGGLWGGFSVPVQATGHRTKDSTAHT